MLYKLGGRKFVLALLIWYTTTIVFVLTNKLAGAEFAAILIATLGLYGGSNVYNKKVQGD